MPADLPAAESLPAVLQQHQIDLPAEQISLLESYCRLLWAWNEKINLTRHTDYEKFVSRDVVDTLAIARHLGPSERVLDIGSGGGVPGIVLAIVRPDLSVTLSESVAKKARVLSEIVRDLGVKVAAEHCRAEDVLASRSFDSLVARAVAPLPKLLGWLAPHWGAFDRLLAVKGPSWVEERHEARELGLMKQLQLRKLETWPLPGTDSESVLLEIRPKE
ncbi:MAG TPA: 16S rRNA (guanine(527)-N(7))-methyltransferase RsmG [Pirellulales bacterium]|nr:16S rRNA (guanine(527)-N(7))-methyltransferase RsmG [Pirellulales bacterium]